MEKLRSLYNDWEVSTPEANEIYREASDLLAPIFENAVKNGLRVREVAHQIRSAVDEQEAYHCIKRNMEAHKRGEKPEPVLASEASKQCDGGGSQ